MLNGNGVAVADRHANGNGSEASVTYAEVRRMARWMQTFTAQDLADALRVPVELGDKFVTALLWHGIAHDSGGWVEGPDGIETVYEMEPLPPGPNEHETGIPPEVLAVIEMYGGFELKNLRGLPVRIRTERQMRRSLSTPGARQVHRNRERAYEKQQEAVKKRAEEQKAKAPKEPKWKRKKAKGTVKV